jgi:phosphinothricin acetyltransferase
MNIRSAKAEDSPVLAELRNYYIAHSGTTFDTQPLTPTDIDAWFSQFRNTGAYRLLVALQDNQIMGFCSSQLYRQHPAFSKTIETSIYIAPQCSQRGVGSALYTALFDALVDERLHRAVVGIALPNPASIALHRKFGFTEVGIFNEYAHKNGQFISSQWMEKRL